MTTGNDPALPNPDDHQPLATDGSAPAALADGQQQPGTQPTEDTGSGLQFLPPQPGDDPDETALSAAMAAAEAEEAGAGATAQTDPPQDPAKAGQPNTTEGTQPSPKPGQQAQPSAAPSIPKPRFDAALHERDEARRGEAYWRGVAEARGQAQPGQPGQQQQQQPQLTPEQALAAIKTQRKELATKFDAGELTAADWEEQRSALDDKADTIREDQLAARLKPAANAPQGSDLYLSQKTAEIEDAHPWVTVADQVGTEVQWKSITQMAIDNLVQRGVDPTKGDTGKYELRTEVAKLWTDLGPAMIGNRAKAKGLTLPGTQQAQPSPVPQPNQLSPAAKARAAALQRRAGAPPDLATMSGGVGDLPGNMSEERLEGLSEEDFDKLPIATRNKALGINA